MKAMEEGLSILLTGLPASGKTTLASALASRLHRRGNEVEVLDADSLLLLRFLLKLNGPEEMSELLHSFDCLSFIVRGPERFSPGWHLFAAMPTNWLPSVDNLDDPVEGELPIVLLGDLSQIGGLDLHIFGQGPVAPGRFAVTRGAVRPIGLLSRSGGAEVVGWLALCSERGGERDCQRQAE